MILMSVAPDHYIKMVYAVFLQHGVNTAGIGAVSAVYEHVVVITGDKGGVRLADVNELDLKCGIFCRSGYGRIRYNGCVLRIYRTRGVFWGRNGRFYARGNFAGVCPLGRRVCLGASG